VVKHGGARSRQLILTWSACRPSFFVVSGVSASARHLIHDFRFFSNLTPTEYVRLRSGRSIFSNTELIRLFDNGRKSMKRTFALILAALAAAALFGALVHAVLVAAHLSEPAATTVYGLTPGDSGPPRSLCWRWSA